MKRAVTITLTALRLARLRRVARDFAGMEALDAQSASTSRPWTPERILRRFLDVEVDGVEGWAMNHDPRSRAVLRRMRKEWKREDARRERIRGAA